MHQPGEAPVPARAPLLDRLGDLTAQRDRDLLDTILATSLHDLLGGARVAVHRVVGDRHDRRWWCGVVAGDGFDVSVGASDGAHDLLPMLDERPALAACLAAGEPQLSGQAPGQAALFPIDLDDATAGVLEVQARQPLSPDQWRTVTAVLRIGRNVAGLLDYGQRDTLTGLLNRKTFDDAFLKSITVAAQHDAMAGEAADRRVAAAERYWLGVIDVDHFKRVNDQHGHLIGDEVLLLLSRLMRSTFRHHDRLYRFGGEEFVVLMRCARPEDAQAALERLRRRVQSSDFPQVGRITISIGFTEVRPSDTPGDAFERADRAVYHVKANGRNAAAFHEDLVRIGSLLDESGVKVGAVELF